MPLFRRGAFQSLYPGGKMASTKWATPLIGVLAVACGDAVGAGNDETVDAIAAPVSPQLALEAVQINQVRVVVGGVKLETAGVDETEDQLFPESGVVVATVSGGLATADVMLDVPAGTYKEIEVWIDKLELGKPEEEPLIAAHEILADASIAVTGTVSENGMAAPFTFTAALDIDMEVKFESFVVFGGGPASATLALDTSGWFLDADGAFLDPRDPANRSDIEGNIQKSFEAFARSFEP